VFFAVRHLASGSPSQRSTVAFIVSATVIVGVTVLTLGGVWRAQRIATPRVLERVLDGASSP
jgi:hypothetical protein